MGCYASRSTAGRSTKGPCRAYPAGSVGWLRRHLEAYGLTLRPRQLVLTGTPLGLYPVRPDDIVRVTAARLGTVEAMVVP